MNTTHNNQFFDLSIYSESKKRILDEISKIIDNRQFIMGPQVEELEKRLSKYTGAAHCVTCASGTDALKISLLAAGIKPDDRVITTPFSFVAAAEAIVSIGANPIFVDIDPDTFNMCPNQLRTYLKTLASSTKANNPDFPKAIIAVDLFGLPADWPSINEIAKEFALTTIADAAQSFSGSIFDKKVGNLADITCTSFYPTKPLGCFGDGGAIFTNFSEIADTCKAIRVHGSRTTKYKHELVGMNSRLDTIQAAVLTEKLKAIDNQRRARGKIADIISIILDKYNIQSQVQHPTLARSSFAVFAFLTKSREKLRTMIESRMQIPTAVYYPAPIHEQPAYKHYYNQEIHPPLPIAENISKSIMSIPLYIKGTNKLTKIITTLESILEEFTKNN